MKLAACVWIYPDYIWIFRARISIEEAIEFFTMAMKVNDEPDLSLFAYLLNEGLNSYDLWTILIFFSYIPIPIQILSC